MKTGGVNGYLLYILQRNSADEPNDCREIPSEATFQSLRYVLKNKYGKKSEANVFFKTINILGFFVSLNSNLT